VLSHAEFEALAAEAASVADSPAALDSEAELSAHSDAAADVDASQHTPTPLAAEANDPVAPHPGSVCSEPLPPPEHLLAFPAPMSVAGPASASASARRLGFPSCVGPDFARLSQQRLQELLATRAAHETLVAC
jgi:hypothetical protein